MIVDVHLSARLLGISGMSVHRPVQRNILPVEQPAAGLPFAIRQSDLFLPKVEDAAGRIQRSLPTPLPDDPSQLKLF